MITEAPSFLPPCPVEFREQTHQYFLGDRELCAVSRIIKRVSPPFDPDGTITKRCADREGITVEELRARWDKKRDTAVERGHWIHKALERFIDGDLLAEEEYAHHIAQLKRWPFRGKLYPETILWNETLGIAGRADLIEVTGEQTCRIYDFKTNEKLEKENRWNKFLLSPVQHLPATEFCKYELQLSFYAVMLQAFGFAVERMTVFHIDHSGKWSSHPCRNLEQYCTVILQHFRGRLL